MRPTRLDDKWAIKVSTKEFGEVIMLEEEKLAPLTFSTKNDALEFIQSIREENAEIVGDIKRNWRGNRQLLERITDLICEPVPMVLEDVEQVEWLMGHIEHLNNYINSLNGKIKDLEKNIEVDKIYNENFLKLLRTQSCINDGIDLINKRFEAEKKGEKYKW